MLIMLEFPLPLFALKGTNTTRSTSVYTHTGLKISGTRSYDLRNVENLVRITVSITVSMFKKSISRFKSILV